MSSKRHESAMSRVMNSVVDVKYGALLHQKSYPAVCSIGNQDFLVALSTSSGCMGIFPFCVLFLFPCAVQGSVPCATFMVKQTDGSGIGEMREFSPENQAEADT